MFSMFMRQYRVPGTGPASRHTEFRNDGPVVLSSGLRWWVEFGGRQPAVAGSLCHGESEVRPELLSLAEAAHSVACRPGGEPFVYRETFSSRRTPGVARSQ